MDNASDENRRKNLWQHQHGSVDNNQQFYANQYQVRLSHFRFSCALYVFEIQLMFVFTSF